MAALGMIACAPCREKETSSEPGLASASFLPSRECPLYLGRTAFKVDQGASLRHLFFCLNCSTLIKHRVFFLMPQIHFSEFRAESRNMHVHTEANPPISPRRGSSVAGGLVAGGDGDGG